MFSHFLRTLAWLTALSALTAAHPAHAQYTRVYFSQKQYTVPENHGTVAVGMSLSQQSTLEIVVPFYMDEASTAVAGTAEDDEEGDFFISSANIDGFEWDPETQSGTVVFPPGRTNLQFPVRIINDAQIQEHERTIIFRIDEENLTIARPVEPSSSVIEIIDNDPIAVHFNGTEFSALEGRNMAVDFILSSTAPRPVKIQFAIDPGSGGFRRDSNWPEGDIFTIPAGSNRMAFNLPTLYDPSSNGETKEFEMSIVSAWIEDSSTELVTDSRKARLSIMDSGPLEVEFFHREGESTEGRSIPDYGVHSLSISISAPQTQRVTIPVTLGGTAIRGDQDQNQETYHYITNLTEDNTMFIPAGSLTTTLQFGVGSARRVPQGHTITIELGTPVLADDTELPLGENRSFTFTIQEDDPIQLNFAQNNPQYDPSRPAAYPAYIPSGGNVVARQDGAMLLPIILNRPVGLNTEFKLEILEEGTTARILTPTTESVEDWDFFVANNQGSPINVQIGQKLNFGITAGNTEVGLNLGFNFEGIERQTYPWQPDAASDKIIRFRISEVNTDKTDISLGEYSEYELVLRDLPDIEVTHLFLNPISHGEGNPPVRNPQTALHELLFDFNLSGGAPSSSGLEGYRSYKIAFNTAIYDPENPDAESNDPLVRSNTSQVTYDLIVTPPFRPRYPANTTFETLIEGKPRSGVNFFDENADIRVSEALFYHRLNWPLLDPARETFPTSPGANPADPFSFLIEFTNGGRSQFDLDRLTREGAVRIFLSRNTAPQANRGSTISTSRIIRFLPDHNSRGDVFVEIDNPNRNNIHVEYLDDDGIWRAAQAPVLRNLGSRLLWIDHGPPRTHKHPSEVPFRIYRFYNAN